MQLLSRTLGFDAAPLQRAVRVEPVFFWAFRTPAPLVWSAAYHSNGLFFTGGRFDAVHSLMRRSIHAKYREGEAVLLPKASGTMGRRSFRERGFEKEGDVAVYDFTGEHSSRSLFRGIPAKRYGFRGNLSLARWVAAAQAFVASVREAHDGREALQRRAVLAFLLLGPRQEEELRHNPALAASLLELFTQAHEARLFPLIVASEVNALPKEFLRGSSFTAFLGTERQAAHALFPEGELVESFSGDKHVGVVLDRRQPGKIVAVTKLEHEREEWFLQKQAALREQDEAWLDYLKILAQERDHIGS